MEATGLPPPAPFLTSPGKPSVTWKDWECRFETFLTAIGGTSYTASRKKALLLYSVGAEAQRVYQSQPTITKLAVEDEYQTALRQLILFNTPQVNVVTCGANQRYRKVKGCFGAR